MEYSMTKPVSDQSQSVGKIPDKAAQRQILKRFVQITLGRLARIRLDLSKNQQLFLDALPVLLHTNHPKFPCFVAENTASGICRYHPSGAEIQKLQSLSPGFTPVDQSNKEQILGVFLSGDCGTIIESDQQNIKVWVCHADGVMINELFQLQRKCDLIETWAKLMNLNVKISVVDSSFQTPQQKQNIHLSLNDQANKQNFLELDRLYRSGVMVAGRMPLWWLIPPDQDISYQQYTSLLFHKGFINEEDVIDFGPIPNIPAHEFIALSIDQLARSEKDPYEACIRQLLMEIYITEYPQVKVLGNQFKESVYQDQLDLDKLDPYLMVYRRIEVYLLDRQELQRLELVRRCFYYQVGKHLSQHTSNATWQRKQMVSLVEEWGWNRDHLKLLDRRASWKVEQVKNEFNELNYEVSNSFRYIAEFSRRYRTECVGQLSDLSLLGKKLHARFDHKIGKIELLNPGISETLVQSEIFIAQTKHRSKTVWAVYDELVSSRDIGHIRPINRSENLIELLAWCLYNGLVDDKTRLEVIAGEHDLKNEELHALTASLQDSPSLNSQLLQTNQEAFSRPSRPVTFELFVNVACDVKKTLKSQKRVNAASTTMFDYGDKKNNVVLNIEILMVNSWGEVICNRFEGSVCLLNCISEFIQVITPGSARGLPDLTVHSSCRYYAEPLKARLVELFADLSNCLYNAKYPMNTRYVLQMKEQLFILQYQQNQVSFKGARNEKDLIKRLGHYQQGFSPIVFDRYALSGCQLPAISDVMQNDMLQVFFEISADKKTATVYVSDEKGSLFSYQRPFYNEEKLLRSLETFLFSTLYRHENQQREELEQSRNFTDIPIVFYQLKCKDDGWYFIEPFELDASESTRDNFTISAIAEKVPGSKEPIFNLLCAEQEFYAVDWGDDLYSSVARMILAKRRSRESYPCHITELELSSISSLHGYQLQTTDFLRFKETIERKINEALKTA